MTPRVPDLGSERSALDVPPPDGADSAEMSSATAAPHPEEMKGTIRLAMGDFATRTMSGRATPAGLICAGIFLCGGLLSLATLARRAHR